MQKTIFYPETQRKMHHYMVPSSYVNYTINNHLFCKLVTIKAALKSQIISVLNPICIKDLKNSNPETITYSIPYIFTYLILRCGHFPSQLLSEEEEKVQNLPYRKNNMPIVIFNAIKNLSNLEKAAKLTKLQQELINYG